MMDDYFAKIPVDKQWITKKDGLVFKKYLDKLGDKGTLLEIGTGAGTATRLFALLKPGWEIYTIDNHDFVDRLDYPEDLPANVHAIVEDSKTVKWDKPVDVLFIDGDHSYEGCRSDFERFGPFVKHYVFFHDYWRPDLGVQQVVDECPPYYKVEETGRMAVINMLRK